MLGEQPAPEGTGMPDAAAPMTKRPDSPAPLHPAPAAQARRQLLRKEERAAAASKVKKCLDNHILF